MPDYEVINSKIRNILDKYRYREISGGDRYEDCNYCIHVTFHSEVLDDGSAIDDYYAYCDYLREKAELNARDRIPVISKNDQAWAMIGGLGRVKSICDAFCKDELRIKEEIEELAKYDEPKKAAVANGCLVSIINSIGIMSVITVIFMLCR